VRTSDPVRVGPALAVTYNGDDPLLLERIASLVDVLEVTPDALAASEHGRARLRREALSELESVIPHVKLLAHGVGLSIGSFDHWQAPYLSLLDQLLERFDLEWHSEHLGYSVVADEEIGTMLPLPRTDEALRLVCERVELIQARYRLPFLLEHVIQLLPDAPARYSPAGFLNAITSRTGCGLILDVYNLECDAYNQGLDIDAFVDELDLSSIIEIHIVGGIRQDGFQLDVHSRLTKDSTLARALDIVQRAPCIRAITFEYLMDAVNTLGRDAICGELGRIRAALDHDCARRPATRAA
jgi:uncharacterized protein